MFVLRIRDAAQPLALRNVTERYYELRDVYGAIETLVNDGMIGRPFTVSYEPDTDTDTDDNGWRTIEADPFDRWYYGDDAVTDAYAALMAA